MTDGYARALQLESERLRLERRIGELAHSFDGPEDADELKSLAGRLRDVGVELEGLPEASRRELLPELAGVDLAAELSVAAVLARRKATGGTAPVRVLAEAKEWKRKLAGGARGSK